MGACVRAVVLWLRARTYFCVTQTLAVWLCSFIQTPFLALGCLNIITSLCLSALEPMKHDRNVLGYYS